MKGRFLPAFLAFLVFASLRTWPESETFATLDQCLKEALEGSTEARLAGIDRSIDQARYAQARAANSFALAGSSGASWTGIPVDSRAVSDDTTTREGGTAKASLSLSRPGTQVGLSGSITTDLSSSFSLSLSHTLWDGYPGGQGKADVQKAELTLRSQGLSSEADRRDLAFRVRQAYHTLLAAQRAVEINDSALSQRQEEMKRTQALYEAEKSSGLELAQARINLSQAELDLRAARNSLTLAREKLSALVGWPREREYAIEEIEGLPAVSVDISASIQKAFAQRSELRLLELSLASGQIDLALKRSQNSVQVSANGEASWTSDRSDENLGTWNAGLSVSIPIFDAGLSAARIREARLQLDSYRLQAEQLQASIVIEVKQAAADFEDLLARAGLAEENLALAEDRYELARVRSERGLIATLDLLDASVALTTARTNLAKARSDAQLGLLALEKAIGE